MAENSTVYQRRNPNLSQYYQCVENHFETLEQVHDERFSRQYGFFRSYIKGVIYRTTAESMMDPFVKEKASDILEATTQAGQEIVESMKISPETMARIRQPLVDSQLFADMGNLFWQTCIAEDVTPKKFREENMVPRPESLEDFMLLFPFGLNSEAAGDRKVFLQFKFSGQVEDSCYFTIETGNINVEQGVSENPDLTIETPLDVWMDIITRKVDGQRMFMEQKYKVHGDLSLMIELFKANTT